MHSAVAHCSLAYQFIHFHCFSNTWAAVFRHTSPVCGKPVFPFCNPRISLPSCYMGCRLFQESPMGSWLWWVTNLGNASCSCESKPCGCFWLPFGDFRFSESWLFSFFFAYLMSLMKQVAFFSLVWSSGKDISLRFFSATEDL